jgi:hypothetical protein
MNHTETLEDAIEDTYWNFDARRKGTGPYQGRVFNERDAFKWAVRRLQNRNAKPATQEVNLYPGDKVVLTYQGHLSEDAKHALVERFEEWLRSDKNAFALDADMQLVVLRRATSVKPDALRDNCTDPDNCPRCKAGPAERHALNHAGIPL